MTTTITETFEEGTNGTTIATANVTGFTSVHAPPSGGTYAYDTTHVAHGTLSAKCATAATSGTAYGMLDLNNGAAQNWFRAYYYFTAVPSVQINLAYCGTATGGTGTRVCRVTLGTSGKMSVDASTTTNVIPLNSAIPLNKWFRVEGWVIGNSSTGQVHLARYDSMESVTPTENRTSSAAQNTGGVPVGWQIGGWVNSISSLVDFWTDDVVVSDAGAIGPAVPPTGNSGAFFAFL